MTAPRFDVVQPWGPDRGREATLISSHLTADGAFAAIDTLADQMAKTGAPSDAVELIVVDDRGTIIPRRTN